MIELIVLLIVFQCSMSKKNIRNRKSIIYPRYSFDRNAANACNDMAYEKWLIADEGQEKPDPQRLTNFIFKYGVKNKKTGELTQR